MKKIIKTIQKHNGYKRIISVLTALVLCFGCMPVFEMLNTITDMRSSVIVASAESRNLDSVAAIKNYADNYAAANANDTLVFSHSDGDSGQAVDLFTPIGTEAAPFNGKIIISDDDFEFNIKNTLFGVITDNVEIVKMVSGSETSATVKISRAAPATDSPLFAQKVKHVDGKSANWSFHYKAYTAKDGVTYVYNYSGLIGELDVQADVTVSSFTNDNKAQDGDKIANVSSSGDLGLICNKIGANAKLTVGSITMSGGNSDTNYTVTTSGRNAGGLVGSMASGSKLTLDTSVSNPQASSKAITASTGYAGGIVGDCDGGEIVFNNTAAYVVSQVITGKTGSGGIAGHYNINNSSEAKTINTQKVSIGNTCKVNGAGNCGGLFGVLQNNGTLTISGSGSVAPDHKSDTAKSYGGLVGRYYANSLTNTLTVSATSSIAPTRTGGSVEEYGGAIGQILGSAYVLLNGVTVNASNAAATQNFGGLVGQAQDAFVELQNTNSITYSSPSTSATFGGVVGDLEKGVLYLQGITNLSGAPAVTSSADTSGQVVGYRDCALVFAASGWTMTRPTSDQVLDDIGSWGEIVRFNSTTFKQTDVLDIDTTNHFVTLKAAVTSMSDKTDFAKTALNIQLNNGQSTGVFRVSSGASSTSKSETLRSTTLSLANSSVDIDLSGTGITGLTRDNGDSYITFSGTFNGNNGMIKLAVGEEYCTQSKTNGNGKIYKHQYIGLFGKTSGATIQNVKIDAQSSIKVSAKQTMYVGNVVGQATGGLTLSNIEICNDTTGETPEYATIDNAGSDSYFGGMVGNLTSAGTVAITNCTYNGEIKGSATDSNIGGLIGSVSDGTNTFSGTTVSGKITADSGNKVGGAIAVANESIINLNGLTVSGLVMNVTGESGGFLGHEWNKTNVEFKQSGSNGVVVNNSSSLTATGTSAAGLVHTATGYWKVNDGGISLESMSVTDSSATEFGLLIYKGFNDNSAIYLELLPGASSFITSENKSNVSLTLGSVTVFDELVAYSASGDVSDNGQGVVSIATTGHALLKMNDSNTGTTYQHQTAYLDTNTTKCDNNHTRYYYNLDAYRTTQSNDAQKLLIWSVKQYAHNSISGYFSAVNTIGSATTDDIDIDIDMRGYSYYPVDLTGTLTITGELSLYNSEFDTTESGTTDSRESADNAQHYLIHNSLLRNVSGTLNADIKLNGNVKTIGSYCGALVMGTVSSNATGSPAKINITGLVLDGIAISGTIDASTYAPLLINKAGSNATLTISNVSNNSTDYLAKGAGKSKYIASSLLGRIGTSTAENVKLTFSEIKLDGRNAAGVSALSDLDSVYHSKGSLFSKATLVDTLAYALNSGYGVYNYTYAQDWAESGDSPRTVTYGAEIEGTVENRDNSVTPSVSKQLHYNNDSTHYTNPVSRADTASTYGSFVTNFQKYVYAGYVSAENKHELRVNIKGSTTAGCGTYNDPYIIRTATDLTTFAAIINGTNTQSQTISVSNGKTTWCDGNHITYTVKDGGNWYTDNTKVDSTKISDDDLRKYLAGAYYKVADDITAAIAVDCDFPGIYAKNANVTSEYVFRGVIDGNTNISIINQSVNPLIVSSNGCVVRNLKITVAPTESKSITQNSSAVFQSTNGGSDFYGAVIGQIFGGDNIIENVSVSFPEGALITKGSGNSTHLVPIGGYVGVVVNGGLIFRDMNGLSQNNQAGIKDANLSGFDDNPTSSSNTKWLYINPIIGRVLNGYAITESDSYKPFEDGSRAYSDGTTVDYWHVTESDGIVTTSVDHNSADKVGVTMRNGKKNYSITDINKNETGKFVMSGTANDSNITVSSAQALFITSLITQCGLGKSTSGKYNNDSTLKPYNANMSTHLGDYDEIGSSDANTSGHDYYDKAKNDTYSGDSNTLPYLIKTYTNESSSSYPAFAVMGSADVYYNLILSGTDTTFYLPDSYRGLGSLMFGEKFSNNLDDFKDNVMFLYGLNGNRKTVSMDMSMSVYAVDNYPTLNNSSLFYKTGFALIDCLQSNYENTASRKFKDLTISGKVKCELLGTDGKSVAYTSDNGKKAPAAAALVGVPVASSSSTNPTPYNVCIENVMLDSMEISGAFYAGGFIGALNVNGEFYFTSCSADDLKVFAGGAAGGLVGYMRNGSAKVIADFTKNNAKGNFGITSVVCASTADKFDTTAIGDGGRSGAGGLIGDRNSSKQADEDNIKISNVTIRYGIRAPTGKGYIGSNKAQDGTVTNPNSISAGGMIGNSGQTSKIVANNVTVENLNICGASSGGMVGNLNGAKSAATFSSCEVTTDNSCSIDSTYNNSAAASGGFIGGNAAPLSVTITDSKLTGYTVSGYYNVGGLIGSNTVSVSNITNDTLSGHTIKGTNSVGGLVGNLSNGGINGYNILINNQTTGPLTEGGSASNKGYIVGSNSSVVKLAGFSRQGSIDVAQMVGNSTSASSESYGTGGYVIFADYNNTAPTTQNAKFSNVRVSGENIAPPNPVGSKTIVTEHTVVAQRNRVGNTLGSDFVTVIGEPVRTRIISETPDDNLDPYDDSLPAGENILSTSATRLRFEPYVSRTVSSVSGLELVSNLDDLTSSKAANGFFIYCVGANAYLKNVPYNKTSNDSCIAKDSINNAKAYYFEKAVVENNVQKYRIFTYNDAGSPVYIHTLSGNNVELSSVDADLFVINKDSTNGGDSYTVSIVNDNKYLQNSNSGGGIRYHGDHKNSNYLFKLYFSGTQLQNNLRANEYDSVTYDGSTISSTGFASSYVLASTVSHSPSAAEDYETYCSGYNNTSYELFYITITTKINITEEDENRAPYVTTNPIFNMVTTANTQWLTSDGVSANSYTSSAAYAILNDTTNKKYQHTGLDNAGKTALADMLTQKLKAISAVAPSAKAHDYVNGDLPVLIVDDIENCNTKIENYLRLLTNNKYKFAYGYYDNGYKYGTADEQSVFKLEISKWKYDNTAQKFVLQSGDAALKCNGYKFSILPTDLDDTDWQISLIDVQFFDPTDTTTSAVADKKIAYRLYVPVVVKKMLYYNLSIRAASTTTYKLDAYPTTAVNLIENLGNPVTFKVTYTYQQEVSEWKAAINNGEDVYRNYEKKLNVKAFGNLFPTNAKIVLVDPNNNADKHYTGSFTNSSGVLSIGSDNNNTLTLNSTYFSGFDSVKINDLLSITVDNDAAAADKHLVECPESEATCAVRKYTDSTHNNVTLFLKYTEGQGDYAVNVTLKPNQHDVNYVQENYYLSIFTQENTSDTNIYHYELSSSGTSFNDSDHPSALIGGEAVHLFLGNLYTNTVTLSEGSEDRKLTSTNNKISATLTANIGFTPNAVDANLLDKIQNENVKIYQTFMLSLERLNSSTDKQRGILVDPTSIVPSEFKVNGSSPSSDKYSLSYNNLKTAIEMPNGYNIKADLVTKAQSAQSSNSSSDPNAYTISVSEKIELTYHPNTLEVQFPQSTEGAVDKGTRMVGYSNISPSPSGGAASRASADTEADSGSRKLYYIEDVSPVEFSYNAVENYPDNKDDGNGVYGQLGIDGNELDKAGNKSVQIKSAGSYNIFNYAQKTDAHYVRVKVKLSRKTTSDNGVTAYSSSLNIVYYLYDFKLLVKNVN